MKILLLLSFMLSLVCSDPRIGQGAYKKHLRKQCGFSGVKFAAYHSKTEWEEIGKEKVFWVETYNICRKLYPTKESIKYENDILDFVKKYAKGSKEKPNC